MQLHNMSDSATVHSEYLTIVYSHIIIHTIYCYLKCVCIDAIVYINLQIHKINGTYNLVFALM